MEIKEGDIVNLKSGGPYMTVKSINESSDNEGNDYADCCWFDQATLKESTFKISNLKLKK